MTVVSWAKTRILGTTKIKRNKSQKLQQKFLTEGPLMIDQWKFFFKWTIFWNNHFQSETKRFSWRKIMKGRERKRVIEKNRCFFNIFDIWNIWNQWLLLISVRNKTIKEREREGNKRKKIGKRWERKLKQNYFETAGEMES